MICAFYNSPKGSKYRHTTEDFGKLLAELPNNKTTLICCDLNFPETNWNCFTSEDNNEQTVIDLFDNELYQQAVNFCTRAGKTLDVAFFKSCTFFGIPDEEFTKAYNCSDNKAIRLVLECLNLEEKPVLGNLRGFGRADYAQSNEVLEEVEFNPTCHTSINKMCEELYDFFNSLIESNVPRHRQSLPPSITHITSNLLKKLTAKKGSSDETTKQPKNSCCQTAEHSNGIC